MSHQNDQGTGRAFRDSAGGTSRGLAVPRRRFVEIAGGALAWTALGNWRGSAAADNDGRLTARPRAGVTTTLESGSIGIGDGARDGVIRMPLASAKGKMPLLVFLHGANGSGARTLARIEAAADQSGAVIVAPDSRGRTWDAIRGPFDEDVAFLNRVLEFVFARLEVDQARLAIGGFSDGASYALSLGLANGDLFPRILACSPGFVVPALPHGRPRIFVSHGTSDQVLPIDQCSRVIVPRLRTLKYDVTFREFEGRHELPPGVASEALRWMTT